MHITGVLENGNTVKNAHLLRKAGSQIVVRVLNKEPHEQRFSTSFSSGMIAQVPFLVAGMCTNRRGDTVQQGCSTRTWLHLQKLGVCNWDRFSKQLGNQHASSMPSEPKNLAVLSVS